MAAWGDGENKANLSWFRLKYYWVTERECMLLKHFLSLEKKLIIKLWLPLESTRWPMTQLIDESTTISKETRNRREGIWYYCNRKHASSVEVPQLKNADLYWVYPRINAQVLDMALGTYAGRWRERN